MSAVQKQAWLCLGVISLTILTVAALYPWLGAARATGGFGVLGLIALSAIFFRRRGNQVAYDERDKMISQRAGLVAYALLWLVFVTAALIAPSIYGAAVPTKVVQNSVWVGFMIMYTIQSIAVLALSRQGATDGAR